MNRLQHILVLAALMLTSVAASAVPASSPEYEVKAAFLYKFGNFVDVHVPPGFPFVVTILGDDPFGDAIDAMVRGKSIGGRPVEVRRVHNVSEIKQGGIVFISASEKPRMREILEALRNTPALTVGDIDGFAAAGGMIGFVLDQNRVRFEINQGAAEEAGVRINAKLLALARIISTEK